MATIPGFVMASLFFLCGDFFEGLLSQGDFNNRYSLSTAWIVSLLLMISDLILPVPASAVMSAAATRYGFTLGFFISFSGLLLSGLAAYFLAGLLGKYKARWICTPDELEEYRRFFDKWGGLSIILSRAVPIFPEVTSLLAGFSGMNFKKYLLVLLAGCAPTAFLYSWIGSHAREEPFGGIFLSIFISLLLWMLLNKFLIDFKLNKSAQ